MGSWYGFKTAYLLNHDEHPCERAIEYLMLQASDKRLMDLCKNFPDGWEFRSEGINGACGFMVEFDIDHAPSEDERNLVQKKIHEFCNSILMHCSNCQNDTKLKVVDCDEDERYFCSTECEKEFNGEDD